MARSFPVVTGLLLFATLATQVRNLHADPCTPPSAERQDRVKECEELLEQNKADEAVAILATEFRRATIALLDPHLVPGESFPVDDLRAVSENHRLGDAVLERARASDSEDKSADARARLGAIREMLGRRSDAIRDYEQALELDASHQGAAFRLFTLTAAENPARGTELILRLDDDHLREAGRAFPRLLHALGEFENRLILCARIADALESRKSLPNDNPEWILALLDSLGAGGYFDIQYVPEVHDIASFTPDPELTERKADEWRERIATRAALYERICRVALTLPSVSEEGFRRLSAFLMVEGTLEAAALSKLARAVLLSAPNQVYLRAPYEAGLSIESHPGFGPAEFLAVDAIADPDAAAGLDRVIEELRKASRVRKANELEAWKTLALGDVRAVEKNLSAILPLLVPFGAQSPAASDLAAAVRCVTRRDDAPDVDAPIVRTIIGVARRSSWYSSDYFDILAEYAEALAAKGGDERVARLEETIATLCLGSVERRGEILGRIAAHDIPPEVRESNILFYEPIMTRLIVRPTLTFGVARRFRAQHADRPDLCERVAAWLTEGRHPATEAAFYRDNIDAVRTFFLASPFMGEIGEFDPIAGVVDGEAHCFLGEVLTGMHAALARIRPGPERDALQGLFRDRPDTFGADLLQEASNGLIAGAYRYLAMRSDAIQALPESPRLAMANLLEFVAEHSEVKQALVPAHEQRLAELREAFTTHRLTRLPAPPDLADNARIEEKERALESLRTRTQAELPLLIKNDVGEAAKRLAKLNDDAAAILPLNANSLVPSHDSSPAAEALEAYFQTLGSPRMMIVQDNMVRFTGDLTGLRAAAALMADPNLDLEWSDAFEHSIRALAVEPNTMQLPNSLRQCLLTAADRMSRELDGATAPALLPAVAAHCSWFGMPQGVNFDRASLVEPLRETASLLDAAAAEAEHPEFHRLYAMTARLIASRYAHERAKGTEEFEMMPVEQQYFLQIIQDDSVLPLTTRFYIAQFVAGIGFIGSIEPPFARASARLLLEMAARGKPVTTKSFSINASLNLSFPLLKDTEARCAELAMAFTPYFVQPRGNPQTYEGSYPEDAHFLRLCLAGKATEPVERVFRRSFEDLNVVFFQNLLIAGRHDLARELLAKKLPEFVRDAYEGKWFYDARVAWALPEFARSCGDPGLSWMAESIVSSLGDDPADERPEGGKRPERVRSLAARFPAGELLRWDWRELALVLATVDREAALAVSEPLAEILGDGLLSPDAEAVDDDVAWRRRVLHFARLENEVTLGQTNALARNIDRLFADARETGDDKALLIHQLCDATQATILREFENWDDATRESVLAFWRKFIAREHYTDRVNYWGNHLGFVTVLHALCDRQKDLDTALADLPVGTRESFEKAARKLFGRGRMFLTMPPPTFGGSDGEIRRKQGELMVRLAGDALGFRIDFKRMVRYGWIRTEELAARAEALATLHPDQGVAVIELAEFVATSGDREKSLRLLESAASFDECEDYLDFQSCWLGRARVFFALNEDEKAYATYEAAAAKARTLPPNSQNQMTWEQLATSMEQNIRRNGIERVRATGRAAPYFAFQARRLATLESDAATEAELATALAAASDFLEASGALDQAVTCNTAAGLLYDAVLARHPERRKTGDDRDRQRAQRLRLLSAASPDAVEETIVEGGSDWSFDVSEIPAKAWREAAFDDAHWLSGSSPVGYGEDDLQGKVPAFRADGQTPVTVLYLRKTFSVGQPESIRSLRVKLRRDDGAVVYLNGAEIVRDNMPEGEVGPDSFAVRAIGGLQEGLFQAWNVPVDSLIAGDNLLAVEVHQADPTSSDIVFDLALVANGPDDDATGRIGEAEMTELVGEGWSLLPADFRRAVLP